MAMGESGVQGRRIRHGRGSLVFELTPRCNQRCRYCYCVWKGGFPYPKGELGTREVREVLDRVLVLAGSGRVTLGGGEPLLRDDLEEIVRHLAARGIEVTLSTNGTLLDHGRIRALLEAGLDRFLLTILSSRPEVHDWLTRSDSFERVVDAVAGIRYLGGRVDAAVVGTALNLRDLGATLEMCAGMGVDRVDIAWFSAGGEGARHRDLLMPELTDVEAALAVADRAPDRLGLEVASASPLPPCVVDPDRYPNVVFATCAVAAGEPVFTVDPTGNLRPCTHSPLILGNVRTRDPARLRADERERLYEGALPPSCAACGHLPECGGGCRASSDACYGRPDLESPLSARLRARALGYASP